MRVPLQLLVQPYHEELCSVVMVTWLICSLGTHLTVAHVASGSESVACYKDYTAEVFYKFQELCNIGAPVITCEPVIAKTEVKRFAKNVGKSCSCIRGARFIFCYGLLVFGGVKKESEVFQ